MNTKKTTSFSQGQNIIPKREISSSDSSMALEQKALNQAMNSLDNEEASNQLIYIKDPSQTQNQIRKQLDETEFMDCPQCNKSSLKIKLMKTGKIFASCNGYPECKKFMEMPQGIKALQMMEYACKKCKDKSDEVIMKFKIIFDLSKVGSEMNQG